MADGLHVAITGASSGIGAALVRELGRDSRITMVARRRELLEGLAKDLPRASHIAVHDLSEPGHFTDWLAPAEAALGPIDVLVNNAGIENTGLTAEADPALATRLLYTNLHAPLMLTRALLPAMLARRSGVIVYIASVAALAPAPRQTWYGASKAGLAAFSESLRGELRGSGVHIVTVYPGPVTTPMAEHAYQAFGGRKGVVGMAPEGKPEVLAALVRTAIERRQDRIVYPKVYGMTRWVPWVARWATDLAMGGRYK